MSLSTAAQAQLRILLPSLPEPALQALNAGLSAETGESAGRVREAIAEEIETRRAASLLFEPLTGLVPGNQLRAVWTNLARLDPTGCEWLKLEAGRRGLDEFDVERLDTLCLTAAEVARDQRLAVLVRLVPLLRRSFPRLAEWVGADQREHGAAARLAYRDAAAVDPSAGPLFVEALMTRLKRPGDAIRLLTAFANRPNDRYAAASELAFLGEDVLSEAERLVQVVQGFDDHGGPDAGRAAAAAAETASGRLQALDDAVELTRDGPWGVRALAARRALAANVEAHLAAAERAVRAALPMTTTKKGTRALPDLRGEPDPAAVRRATTLAAFVQALPGSAQGGFSAVRARVAAAAEDHLHAYVEFVLDRLHEDGGLPSTRAWLEAATAIQGELCGEAAARLSWRRAEAA